MATRARRQALRVVQLGSGSSGNATLVAGGQGAVLVDAGFSAKELGRRIHATGVPLESVRGIVLSHAHRDHCRGAAVLARRLSVPIWATGPTLAALPDRRGLETLMELEPARACTIGDIRIESLAVSHDAPGTVIFRLDGRLGIATDLGLATDEVGQFLSDLDGLILEFNHDVAMLQHGPYPPWLKLRILSVGGHLSNDQASELLASSPRALPRQALWLGHLSRQNNDPKLARRAAQKAIDGRQLEVHVTRQDVASPLVELRCQR